MSYNWVVISSLVCHWSHDQAGDKVKQASSDTPFSYLVHASKTQVQMSHQYIPEGVKVVMEWELR